jgi:molybdate transport repressor ModE-like protein
MLDYPRWYLAAMPDGLQPRDSKPSPTRRPVRSSDLELRQLRAFVALVDEGSVTAAARALRLSQSTVSEALSSLERALGTSVIRRRRGSHDSLLTPTGQALLPNARELLAGVEKTYIAVAEAAVQARGAVNIVANESVSTYLLPKPLAHLREHWPNTVFSVSVATCADVHRGIENGTFDVGMVLQRSTHSASTPTATPSRKPNPKPHNNADDTHLLAPVVPLVIFASPAHPLATPPHREHLFRRDLSDLVIFVSDPVGEFHDLLQNFLLEDGLPSARLQSAGSIEGVKQGVKADPRALGILPIYAIQEELRTGQAIRLDIVPSPPALQLVALLSQVKEHHRGIFELIDDIKHMLAVHEEFGIEAAHR